MDESLEGLRRAAPDHVAGAVPDLVATALEEARRRVHADLVEVFTAALSAAALRQLGAGEDRAGANAAPSAGRDACAWYVYCVVDAQSPQTPDQPGIDPAHGVTTIEQAGLAAVVSRVPLAEFDEAVLSDRLQDMSWVERTVRSHERVVQSVAAHSTPVPMRVCSIFRDREGVSDMLQRERAPLANTLAQLRDTAEWAVKAFAGPVTELVSAGASVDHAGGDGAAYMHRRLDARRQKADAHQVRHNACAEVHEALTRCARDACVIPVQRPEVSGRPRPMVLNAAYLVAHEDAPAFRAEVERVHGEVSELGLELEMSGPWPPYNFVPSGIGGA